MVYGSPAGPIRLTTYLVKDAKPGEWVSYARESLTGSFPVTEGPQKASVFIRAGMNVVPFFLGGRGPGVPERGV